MVVINNNYLSCIFSISKKYNLPHDITKHIYDFYINLSAQSIINAWYRLVSVQSTNLCILITKLPVYHFYDDYGERLEYFDINDQAVNTTFKICKKYINTNISCHLWWAHWLRCVFNSLDILETITPTGWDTYYNVNYIFHLFVKLDINYLIAV